MKTLEIFYQIRIFSNKNVSTYLHLAKKCTKYVFQENWIHFYFLQSISTSRDSSVGRASDWRSEGPWFDPWSRQIFLKHFVLSSLKCFSIIIQNLLIFMELLWFKAKDGSDQTINWLGTGKSFSEALILATTNPQYDNRLFMVIPWTICCHIVG